MAAGAEVELFDGAEEVADALATRLAVRLAEIQRDGRVPQLALTGGRIATAAYARLAARPADADAWDTGEDAGSAAVGAAGNSAPSPGASGAAGGLTPDWSRVELWWGDERFVDAADEDRNARQALRLLGEPLGLDPALIHVMAASDDGIELDDAAAAYAAELGDTVFDICLLGMGPDGHVASLFPDHPSATQSGDVIAVRSSPKPPPERISLTLPVINRSREVWFLVSGADKADAAGWALTGQGPDVPAAHVSGTERTLWLIDRDAAAAVLS